MVITMSMSSLEIEQDSFEYGEEILLAEWNPAVNLVSEQLQEVQIEEHLPSAAEFAALNNPDDVAAAVSELFMRKMYSYQH